MVVVNTEGHLIRVLNERSVSDGGNLCPLWLVIFKSVRHLIDAIELAVSCSELCFARLLGLETDWNICIGKQGYVFIIFTDFKK